MPTLTNPKHERFAQELAKGKTQEEAYREAGYIGDRTAASRLSTNVNVQARLAELQERSAIRTELTVASITERLMRLADIAEKTGQKTDDAGNVAESSPRHFAVARQALMDVAQLNGLVVIKTDNTTRRAIISEKPLTEAQWTEAAQAFH